MSAADPTFDPAAFDLHVMSTYGRFPIALTRGEGCRVWDSEGRAYLDFAAGIATCTLGHAHPALIDAVSRQIRRLHHVSNLYYIPEQGELARRLCAGAPLEAAVHELEREGPAVAAILLEPLQGEGGIRPGDPAYFQQMRALCDARQILMILDEVQVGVGRTGDFWGHARLGIEPDVITLAKGLAGGLPIGAMLCRRSCDVFEPGDHASTFGGNPLACAAALAVLDTLDRDDLITNARERGLQLQRGLQALADRTRGMNNKIAEVRGWGLILGVELGPDEPRAAIDLARAALEQGLLLVPAGPRVLRLVPPLTVSPGECDEALELIARLF